MQYNPFEQIEDVSQKRKLAIVQVTFSALRKAVGLEDSHEAWFTESIS